MGEDTYTKHISAQHSTHRMSIVQKEEVRRWKAILWKWQGEPIIKLKDKTSSPPRLGAFCRNIDYLMGNKTGVFGERHRVVGQKKKTTKKPHPTQTTPKPHKPREERK